MLVKKKDPNYFPSEKKDLKVGENIELTDPRALILAGTVVAVGEDGEEISAYELYGVVIDNEMEEFQNYMKLKKAEAARAALEQTQTELKEKVKEEENKSKEATGTEEAPLYVAKKNR